MKFTDLGLAEPILRAVADEGYATPTPIQSDAIPAALAGRDVLGCARTGTGKTCAFALPILQRLAGLTAADASPRSDRGRRGRPPRALVLCPTRELATQIFDAFVVYGRHVPVRHTVVFGGVSQKHQVRHLRNGVDVLVATPGRLLDLLQQGHVDLSTIEALVLDEADRMLDMGFIHDIRRVIAEIPEDRQSLLFSATISRDIRRLADTLLRDPLVVETSPESTTVEAIEQRIHHVADRTEKRDRLAELLIREDVGRALVFTRTKHGADRLVRHLRQSAIRAEAIHGNKSQNARTKALAAFRAGSHPVLVATDVASRGIDVDEITHVVNYDMPADPETYVHRIGRTGRAGATGIAITFCEPDDFGMIRAIEKRTGARPEIVGTPPAGSRSRKSDEGTATPRRGRSRPGPKSRGRGRGPRGGSNGPADDTGSRTSKSAAKPSVKSKPKPKSKPKANPTGSNPAIPGGPGKPSRRRRRARRARERGEAAGR